MQSEQFKLHFEIELAHWWFVGRRHILESVTRKILPCSKDVLIIDVGCGTGGNVLGLSEQYQCVGIDPNQEAIDLARQRVSQVEFICGMAPQDLGERVGKARLFLLSDVLEHIKDDRLFLEELVARASKGAYFLITVPADPSLWSKHDESFGHYRRYTQEQLTYLWEDLPLAPVLVSYFNTRLYPMIKLVRGLNNYLQKTSGEANTDLKIPFKPLNGLLTWFFEGEGRILTQLLDGKRKSGYGRGASLMALLQRK